MISFCLPWGVRDFFADSAAHPVGSSVMLLGGFGFLSRLYGLSIDNLVEVEIVLADGRIVVVNEREHPGAFYSFLYSGALSDNVLMGTNRPVVGCQRSGTCTRRGYKV